MSVTGERAIARPRSDRLRARAGAHAPALAVGGIAVALMVTWAAKNGGYDNTTWYWGALVLLGVLGCVTILRFRRPLARPTLVALGALAAYVAWSYLSIAWAQSPGQALEGSNRALMYLLLFALLTTIPWTDRAMAIVLVTFVGGIGVIALVLLLRLGSANGLSHLLLQGRLLAPDGLCQLQRRAVHVDRLDGHRARRASASCRGWCAGFCWRSRAQVFSWR